MRLSSPRDLYKHELRLGSTRRDRERANRMKQESGCKVWHEPRKIIVKKDTRRRGRARGGLWVLV